MALFLVEVVSSKIIKNNKLSISYFFFHHGQSPNFITKSNEITEFQGSE